MNITLFLFCLQLQWLSTKGDLSSQGTWQCLETFWGHRWGWGCGGWRPRWCLPSSQAQLSPHDKEGVTPNVSHVQAEKHSRSNEDPSYLFHEIESQTEGLEIHLSIALLAITQKWTFCWPKCGDCFLMNSFHIIIWLIRANVYRVFMSYQTWAWGLCM